jgi:Na+/melibiose symporter-like transporter
MTIPLINKEHRMNVEDKLSTKEKVGYGLGDTASNLYFQMFINFLLFFYTDVFGIPAAVAGFLFMISRFWDAVNDPLMGIIADRTNTKWGKFRPYLLWMMLPLAVIGVLTFTTPDLSLRGKIIYAYVTYILMMMSYTAINIPYSALLGVLSPHSRQRTSASTYRFVLAFAGAFIVQGATLPLVNSLGQQDQGISLSDGIVSIEEVDTRTSRIILEADDGHHTTSREFLVKINRADERPPVVHDPVGDMVLEQGFGTRRIDLNDIFSSTHGDRLLYEVSSSEIDVVETAVESEYQLILREKGPGISRITLTASDERQGKREHQFTVRINEAGNNPPVLTEGIPDTTLDQESAQHTIHLWKHFADPDADDLTYMASSGNNAVVSAEIKRTKAVLEIRGPGISEIVITATDGRGGSATASFHVRVESGENDPPAIINAFDNIELNEGFGEHVMDVSEAFIDPEGEDLTFSVRKVDVAKGFQYTLIIYGVLACILFYLTFALTTERVQPSKDQQTSLKKDMRDLVRNRPWMILLVMSMFTLGYVIVRMGTILYYFKYYIENELLAALFMVTGTVAVIAGVACTDFLARRLGKKRLYLIVMGLASVFTVVFYHIPKDQIALIFTVNIIISFVMAPQAPLLWAMYADTVDYSEWKYGRRATGLIFSAATFSQKFGMALGGGLAGWLLAKFDFQPNVAQSPETLTGIRLMMSYIPVAGTVVAVIAAFFYELDDKTMERIEKELAARKANRASGFDRV